MKPKTNIWEEVLLFIICHYLFSIEKGKATPEIICENMTDVSEAIRFSTRWRLVFFLSCVVARSVQIYKQIGKARGGGLLLEKYYQVASRKVLISFVGEKTTYSVN